MIDFLIDLFFVLLAAGLVMAWCDNNNHPL